MSFTKSLALELLTINRLRYTKSKLGDMGQVFSFVTVDVTCRSEFPYFECVENFAKNMRKVIYLSKKLEGFNRSWHLNLYIPGYGVCKMHITLDAGNTRSSAFPEDATIVLEAALPVLENSAIAFTIAKTLWAVSVTAQMSDAHKILR